METLTTTFMWSLAVVEGVMVATGSPNSIPRSAPLSSSARSPSRSRSLSRFFSPSSPPIPVSAIMRNTMTSPREVAPPRHRRHGRDHSRQVARARRRRSSGWMFDGLDMGLFPLVARPALLDLGLPAERIGSWTSWVIAAFLVGAAAGGVLFGWLGDRIGRVRAMVWSVLVYSVFSGLCGFAEAPWHLAALRFIALLGMEGSGPSGSPSSWRFGHPSARSSRD